MSSDVDSTLAKTLLAFRPYCWRRYAFGIEIYCALLSIPSSAVMNDKPDRLSVISTVLTVT